MGNVYEGRFKEPRENLYKIICGKDAVITNEEILTAAKVIEKYLNKPE